jgi:predicted CXXCH cytochrome family protein
VAAGSVLLGSAWLLLAAMPVAADGGPHVAAGNSGVAGLAADGCAGCHRAHTAEGEMLLAGGDPEELCLSCHGAASTGATTDVETGIQYTLGAGGLRGTTTAGALRSGGFVEARLDSTDTQRISYPRLQGGAVSTWFSSNVKVLADAAPVTSAHIAFAGTSVVAQGVAWGNGGLNSGVGPAFSNTCTTCHNPHGNGAYRILNPMPGDGTGPLVETSAVLVIDAALPTGTDAAGTRNYTNLWGRTLADVVSATYPGGGTGTTGGDYWRDYLPWNGVPGLSNGLPTPATGLNGDRPMYVPGGTGTNANLTGFRGQITAWCSTCHTRHDQVTGATVDTGDNVFTFRHDVGQSECTQCHVAHGSNAAMPGTFSAVAPYPDAPGGAAPITSASSRLLKIANRGTCQGCHDPTHTISNDNVVQDPPN